MNNETNKPINLRDGAIKAAIWTNRMPSGDLRYSVEITRSYKDQHDQWQDTHSFSGAELLRAARLAEKAYDRANELRADNRADQPTSLESVQ